MLLVFFTSFAACGLLAAAEAPSNGAAPYAPSGWRPAGRQFFLPPRTSATYYAPPPQQYGPPTTEAATTTTEAETTTTEVPTTTEAEGNETARQREETEEDSDVYYVLLPDGRLQRVSYKQGPAPAQLSLLPERLRQQPSNGYVARFYYQDVEPVAPVYSFSGPQLVRIARSV